MASVMHSIELIFILLTLSIGVTALAKKAGKPYPIALVVIGALIGLVPGGVILEELKDFFASDEVFHVAVIAIFLPALLGEASLQLSIQEVRKNLRPIILLAFPGTLLAFAITGALSKTVMGLPLQTALVFGGLMAATDPVSVISVFKSLGVNRRLAVVMEGESLINDGVAVVIFNISVFSLASIMSMGPWGAVAGLAAFFKVVAGGVVTGAALGFMVSWVLRYFDDYPLENTFSVVLFYGTYIIAEYLHVSGVIAVVAAGLVLGNYGKVIGMTPTTRLSISVLWDTIVLVANSLVFILVGLEISRINVTDHLAQVGMAVILVLAGRSGAVFISTIGAGLPSAWKHILNWGGLKGSLSLALALSLPMSFEGRELIIILTFGVVFFSLVVQGTTIGPLIRMLGLQKTVKGLKEYESLTYDLQQALAAGMELDRVNVQGRVSPPVYEELRKELTMRIAGIHRELDRLYGQYPELLREQELTTRKKLLFAEHQAVEKLLWEGFLSKETGEEKKGIVLERLEELDKQK